MGIFTDDRTPEEIAADDRRIQETKKKILIERAKAREIYLKEFLKETGLPIEKVEQHESSNGNIWWVERSVKEPTSITRTSLETIKAAADDISYLVSELIERAKEEE